VPLARKGLARAFLVLLPAMPPNGLALMRLAVAPWK